MLLLGAAAAAAAPEAPGRRLPKTSQPLTERFRSRLVPLSGRCRLCTSADFRLAVTAGARWRPCGAPSNVVSTAAAGSLGAGLAVPASNRHSVILAVSAVFDWRTSPEGAFLACTYIQPGCSALYRQQVITCQAGGTQRSCTLWFTGVAIRLWSTGVPARAAACLSLNSLRWRLQLQPQCVGHQACQLTLSRRLRSSSHAHRGGQLLQRKLLSFSCCC